MVILQKPANECSSLQHVHYNPCKQIEEIPCGAAGQTTTRAPLILMTVIITLLILSAEGEGLVSQVGIKHLKWNLFWSLLEAKLKVSAHRMSVIIYSHISMFSTAGVTIIQSDN